jgi:hypothetical protein|tara:strand:- start:6119 stop:6538 length:420 start_codon:yes stop_codon:yes gene_type:complete
VIANDIEAIEAGYEFLLAYAAQGRPAGVETGPGPHARPTIEDIAEAMQNIAAAFADSDDDFEQVIASDCRKAGAALRFILSQDKIGSEIVDNLNASIHLRAVLTDLFLYSEALEPLAPEEEEQEANGGVETYDASQAKS